MTYQEKLKSTQWQRMRLNVLNLADFKCDTCGRGDEVQLQVHHKFYLKGKEPWEYPITSFRCLCSDCHEQMEESILQLRMAFGSLPYYEINNFICDFNRSIEDSGVQPTLTALRCALGDRNQVADHISYLANKKIKLLPPCRTES